MSVPTAPPETLRLSWWQRMLLPNLPFIAAIAVLFLAVGVSGPEGLLNDSDTGWHIVTGERILETGKLPRTDPYSFSKPGEPWFAWEWLSDVILGAAHGWLGLAGVVLLACLALAATAWMWCAFAIWLGGDRFVLSTLMSLAILSSLIHWHARPHLFSWIFLIGWLWLLEDTPARLSIRRLAGVLLFMVLWTNLHGSFFLAFFLAGAYLVEFWFTDRRRAAVCLFEFGAALLATFANPYGWQLHVHLYRYLSNSEMLAQIQEFQSPGFHGAGGLLLILLFLTATGGAVVCLEQRRYARTLVVALLVMIGLRSARGIPVIAFVALPLVTASVTRALERLGRLKPLFEESSNFGRIERQCNGAVLLGVAVLALAWWFSTPGVRAAAQFPPKRFPVEASRYVERLDPAARIFAPDQYGGYLIYRFRGARKVFFDGRSDFYGTRFVNEYLEILSLKPGWRRRFARFQFTHALLPENHPLREELECTGWRRLHADKTAVLLERPPSPPAAPVCAMP